MPGPVTVELLTRWIQVFDRNIAEAERRLTRLDSAIGDGDHGINMRRGLALAVQVLNRPRSPQVKALLTDVGMTVMSARGVAGASGALYGTFFLRMAASAGTVTCLDGLAFATAVRAGLEGVVRRGRAEVGDKTMVDALAPALEALDGALAGGAGLGAALHTATRAAEAGRDATVPMLARRGRAALIGPRSIGHQDPGATSAALLIAAAATALADVQC